MNKCTHFGKIDVFITDKLSDLGALHFKDFKSVFCFAGKRTI